MNKEFSWQLKNNLTAYQKFITEFNVFIKDNNVSKAGNYALNVAVEELITNTIKYNVDSDSIIIDVELVISDSCLELVIIDNAGAFDIHSAEKTDLSKDIDEIEIGGLGIDLVKKLFDSCEYSYVDERNSVRLVYDLKS